MRTITIAGTIVIILLSGCATSMGWGQHYKVVYQNSKSIMIQYDSGISDIGEFGPVAQAHCQQYGKEAVPQPQTPKEGIRNITFICE